MQRQIPEIMLMYAHRPSGTSIILAMHAHTSHITQHNAAMYTSKTTLMGIIMCITKYIKNLLMSTKRKPSEVRSGGVVRELKI